MLLWGMFLVFLILTFYSFCRILHWLKAIAPLFHLKRAQFALLIPYVAFASTIFFGGLLPASPVQVFLKKIGNYWLGTFILLIFFIFLADLLVLILKWINRHHPVSLLSARKGYYLIGLLVLILSVGSSVYGFIHARKLITTHYDVTISKSVPDQKDLKIALVADLHLGYSIGEDSMQKMVAAINAENPDLVVIAGDIYNNNYDAIENPDQIAETLSSINSRYGVYAVYGNHDVSETLIGGFPIGSRSLAYRDTRIDTMMQKADIHMMQDEITTIANGEIYLVGRIDGENAGDGTDDRRSVQDLTAGLDKTKPVIVINHEPNNLQNAANCGVDLLLCGHTHAGQFFPLTLVQPIAWENYYGMKKKDSMYNFVTSGVGVYGPYMRLMTTAEVMIINTHFE